MDSANKIPYTCTWEQDCKEIPIYVEVSSSNQVRFSCGRCALNEEYKYRVLLKDVMTVKDEDIIKNWPPIQDKSIFKKLAGITKSQKQYEEEITSFSDRIKTELQNSIDHIQKVVTASQSQQYEDLIKKYNQISLKDQLAQSFEKKETAAQLFMNLYNQMEGASDFNQSILNYHISIFQNNYQTLKKYLEFTQQKFLKEISLIEKFIQISKTEILGINEMGELTQDIISDNQKLKKINFDQEKLTYDLVNEAINKKIEIINITNNYQNQIPEGFQNQIEQVKDIQRRFNSSLEDSYSKKLISQLLNQNNKISNIIAQSSYKFTKLQDEQNYSLGIIDCSLNINTHQDEFFIHINKVTYQIFVGIVNKDDFENHQLSTNTLQNDKHLQFYLLSSNGYIWNSQDPQNFEKNINFKSEKGQIIRVQVRSNSIQFLNMNTSQLFTMDINSNDKKLVPAFILTDQEDEIQFLKDF